MIFTVGSDIFWTRFNKFVIIFYGNFNTIVRLYCLIETLYVSNLLFTTINEQESKITFYMHVSDNKGSKYSLFALINQQTM